MISIPLRKSWSRKTIPDVEHLKTFLDDGSSEYEITSQLGNLYRNSALPESEILESDNLFPMDILVVAAETKDISSEWNLTNSSTPIVKVEIGTLNLKQGGYIVIEGQPLKFTVDTIIRDGDSGSAERADFNILGKDGTKPNDAGTPGSPGTAPRRSPCNL